MFNVSIYVDHYGPSGKRSYVLDTELARVPGEGELFPVLAGVECTVLKSERLDNAASVRLKSIEQATENAALVERNYQELAKRGWRYMHP